MELGVLVAWVLSTGHPIAALADSASVPTPGEISASAAATPPAQSPEPPGASPPPPVLQNLSQLGLAKVRLRDGERLYVLRRPRFDEAGIGWERVEGFPRRRPAVISGADWDSVSAPPNPIPWREGMRLDTPIDVGGAGAAAGTMIGALSGALLTGMFAAYAFETSSLGYLGLIVGGIGGGTLGHFVGHKMFGPGTRWDPIDGASPVALVAPGSEAGGPTASREARARAGELALPKDETLTRLASAKLGAVRVHADGRPYELIRPDFGTSGVGYRRASGFPRRRPALFAGADWDSVPPPPRPIPWSSVERIERRQQGFGLGTMVGAAAGALVGVLFARLVMVESSVHEGTSRMITITSGTVAAGVGGALGHQMFDPEPRWATVYLPFRQ